MPDNAKGASSGQRHGLEGVPGDRGDASQRSGISGIKSGYSGKLNTECSKGYEDVQQGWGGNVRR